jgi:hypothetical protein
MSQYSNHFVKVCETENTGLTFNETDTAAGWAFASCW